MKTNQVHLFSDLFRLFTGNAYIERLHDCTLTSPHHLDLYNSQHLLAAAEACARRGLAGLSDPDYGEIFLSVFVCFFSLGPTG